MSDKILIVSQTGQILCIFEAMENVEELGACGTVVQSRIPLGGRMEGMKLLLAEMTRLDATRETHSTCQGRRS